MNIPIEEAMNIIKEKLPRKITGGIIAMALIYAAAVDLGVSSVWGKIGVFGCMTAIALIAIITHYSLERQNPTNGEPKE